MILKRLILESPPKVSYCDAATKTTVEKRFSLKVSALLTAEGTHFFREDFKPIPRGHLGVIQSDGAQSVPYKPFVDFVEIVPDDLLSASVVLPRCGLPACSNVA